MIWFAKILSSLSVFADKHTNVTVFKRLLAASRAFNEGKALVWAFPEHCASRRFVDSSNQHCTTAPSVVLFCGVRPWAVQLVLRLNNVQIMVGFETETLNGISGDFKLSNSS